MQEVLKKSERLVSVCCCDSSHCTNDGCKESAKVNTTISVPSGCALCARAPLLLNKLRQCVLRHQSRCTLDASTCQDADRQARVRANLDDGERCVRTGPRCTGHDPGEGILLLTQVASPCSGRERGKKMPSERNTAQTSGLHLLGESTHDTKKNCFVCTA